MRQFTFLFLKFMASFFKPKAILQAENLALRHQLCVLHRSVGRAKVKPTDRVLWSMLARVWSDWKDAGGAQNVG